MLSYSWGMTSNKCGCEAQTPSLVPPIEASPLLINSHFGRPSGKVRRPCHNLVETLPQLGPGLRVLREIIPGLFQSAGPARVVLASLSRRRFHGGFHAYLLLLIGGDHSPIARAQQNR